MTKVQMIMVPSLTAIYIAANYALDSVFNKELSHFSNIFGGLIGGAFLIFLFIRGNRKQEQ